MPRSMDFYLFTETGKLRPHEGLMRYGGGGVVDPCDRVSLIRPWAYSISEAAKTFNTLKSYMTSKSPLDEL